MDKDLQRLYQKQIIGWAQKPVYKKDIALLHPVSTQKNPLCGDIISVGRIAEDDHFYWDGEGCMICCAAAEAFCEAHHNGDILKEDADKIIEEYSQNGAVFEPFKAFQSVKEVPQRIKCVTLIAKAVQKLE